MHPSDEATLRDRVAEALNNVLHRRNMVMKMSLESLGIIADAVMEIIKEVKHEGE